MTDSPLSLRVRALWFLTLEQRFKRQLIESSLMRGEICPCLFCNLIREQLQRHRQQGEVLIELMNSGLSHRAYLQFIENFEEYACLE